MPKITISKFRKKIVKSIEAGNSIDIKFECKTHEYTLVWKCPCCTRANGLWWRFHRDLKKEGAAWWTFNYKKAKPPFLKCYFCRRKFKFADFPSVPDVPMRLESTAKFKKGKKNG